MCFLIPWGYTGSENIAWNSSQLAIFKSCMLSIIIILSLLFVSICDLFSCCYLTENIYITGTFHFHVFYTFVKHNVISISNAL